MTRFPPPNTPSARSALANAANATAANLQWWKQQLGPQTPGKSKDGVTAHTSDPNAYVPMDARQQDLAGHSLRSVVIPRARGDGASRGFNPLVAMPVVIDPLEPGGGFVVDP